ncbi:MAG TPA: YidC/Oxa1 family membrane protein insertase [Anaerolineales bacterium]|nr:YidC/Oxa1 family membrane protein insertase [Anaerolineales bacterium]
MFDFIIVPFTNALVFIYSLLGENFGLAIIVFTILVRVVTYPFNAQQMKSTRAMQELQTNPKYKAMQAKYKGKENREKLAKAQMELYQEMGINPLAGCLPTIIQIPLLISMYWAITRALAATPLQLLDLAKGITLPNAANLIPLNSHFLWMDLGQPERLFIPGIPIGIPVLAILVMVSSYFQSKMMTPTTGANDQAAGMGRMMSLYIPILMAYISYIYAAGLALYFVMSNILSIAQYYISRRPKPQAPATQGAISQGTK